MHPTIRASVTALALVSLPLTASAMSRPTLLLRITGPPLAVGASDLNGDGFEDLVTARGDSIGVLVFFGGPAGDSIPDLVVPAPPHSWAFGPYLAGGRDLNGDGYPDFAAGDPFYDIGRGAVFVYFGGPHMDTLPDQHIPSPVTWDYFGASLSMASDINHDGMADLAVGAPQPVDWESPILGRTYVYFGAPSIGATPSLVLERPPSTDRVDRLGFGTDVAGVGDINGDAADDLLIADFNSIAGDNDGSAPFGHARATLFLGGTDPDSIPDCTYGINWGSGPLMQYLWAAGDFNADGIGDFIASAPTVHGLGSSASGRAYLYFGTHSLTPFPTPSLVLEGNPQSDFGRHVNGGRDVNGDGFPDVVVGQRGYVLLYWGGLNPGAIPAVTIPYEYGHTSYEPYFALSDWNGDGVADVIVGVPGSTEPGHLYIYDVSEPLPARAFTVGSRAIPLAKSGALRLQLQPVDGSYENRNVDPATLRLVSEGTGAVSEIAPVSGKTMVEQDSNHDGVRELTMVFTADDLHSLFASLQGRQEVEARVDGRLVTRRRISALVTLTIVGTGKPDLPNPRLSPNPLNPGGTLVFTMNGPGPVSLRLFDVRGRCVRTVLRNETYAGGEHRIPFAASDDHGAALASGVYFYRLELPSGAQRGRFVVAK